jgi:hypothetical protein
MRKELFIQDSLTERSTSSIEEEISELEDAYADCLKDEVESGTLNLLWRRIKALKQEISRRKN